MAFFDPFGFGTPEESPSIGGLAARERQPDWTSLSPTTSLAPIIRTEVGHYLRPLSTSAEPAKKGTQLIITSDPSKGNGDPVRVSQTIFEVCAKASGTTVRAHIIPFLIAGPNWSNRAIEVGEHSLRGYGKRHSEAGIEIRKLHTVGHRAPSSRSS